MRSTYQAGLTAFRLLSYCASSVPPVIPSTASSDRAVCALAPSQGAGIAAIILCRYCTCTPAQLD